MSKELRVGMTREETIEKLQSIIEENKNSLIPRVHVGFLIHAVKYLKEQSEIVRCKDCKHATMTNNGKMCKYCAVDTDDFGYPREVYHDADWFCADGERKD